MPSDYEALIPTLAEPRRIRINGEQHFKSSSLEKERNKASRSYFQVDICLMNTL